MDDSEIASASVPPPQRSARGSLSRWEYVSLTINHTVLVWLLRILSLSGLYTFGRVLGTVEWIINFKRRRRYARAYRRVFGGNPIPARHRGAMLNYFKRARCDKLFYLTLDQIPRAEALARFTIENRELLDGALGRGRGVYIALAHQGDNHILAMLLSACGYRIIGVRDAKEGAMRRYAQERYDRLYPDFPRMRIHFSDAFPRELYRALSGDGVLMSLLDVAYVRADHQRMGEVRVAGQDRKFVSGPLRIALRCKSPVLQAFIVPGKGFRYRMVIAGMILDPETVSDQEKAVAGALKTYAGNVERFMDEYPELISRV